MPIVSSVVATGRRMNGAERFMAPPRAPARRRRPAACARAAGQTIEREVDDRRRVERERLAHEQAADDRDAERVAELRADAGAERERQRARAAPPSSSS